jgi:hypothetical protein
MMDIQRVLSFCWWSLMIAWVIALCHRDFHAAEVLNLSALVCVVGNAIIAEIRKGHR